MERLDWRNNLEFNLFVGASFLKDLTVCDEIIDYFETHPEVVVPGQVGRGVIETVKKSKDLPFVIVDPDLRKKYFTQLDDCIEQYKNQYEHADKGVSAWGLREMPNVQKYEPGDGFYGWHSERDSWLTPICHRHLVFMTYLNDVTDGGQTEFLYQQLSVQPKKGLTLIWPADWTHTHRGVTSPTQTKYIITGWYSLFDSSTPFI